jgi:hypothetical protein
MGLFGSIIGGALEGAGKGASDAIKQETEYQNKSDLQHEYMAALEAKDLRMAELAQQYHVANTETDFANNKVLHKQDSDAAMDRTKYTEDHADTRNAASIQGSKDVANIHESGANARTAAEIAARRTSEQLQNTHYVPQGDGTIAAVRPNRDGTYSVDVLKDALGKPLQGVKDMPASLLKEVDGNLSMAKLLLAQNPSDPQAQAMYDSAMTMLHSYNGGGSVASDKPMPNFNPTDITALKNDHSPQAMKTFDTLYKRPGAAAFVLQQEAAKGGASAPAAASGAGASTDVGATYAAQTQAPQPVVAPTPNTAPIVRSQMSAAPNGAYSTANPPDLSADKSKFVSRQATRY